MGKIAKYMFFVLAFIIAMTVVSLIGYVVWCYWDFNNNWGSPN